MITKNNASLQLNKTLKNATTELKIGKHLRKAGITKKFGFSSLYIFQILISLVFENHSWNQTKLSKKAADLPKKDAIYRFLKAPTFNWRKFLSLICFDTIKRFQKLTSPKRVSVFILDDSVYSRNRSKKVELLARIYDHVDHKFVKGYSMLTLGWSDGFSFVPVDFALLSSAKKENRYSEINESIDKRTSGYKRRLEAINSKPVACSDMIDHALNCGITANYVLMDSWFTHAPLIENYQSKRLTYNRHDQENETTLSLPKPTAKIRRIIQTRETKSSKERFAWFYLCTAPNRIANSCKDCICKKSQ